MILAVDPGLHGCGVALFGKGDCNRVASASYVTCDNKDTCKAQTWTRMVDAVVSWALPDSVNILVIELPQVYQGRKQKGDPNDLIDLAAVVGGICARFDVPTKVYLPAEWKGQVPKEIMHERARKRLTPEEVGMVSLPRQKSLHHNVWDAVALGLVHAGRL